MNNIIVHRCSCFHVQTRPSHVAQPLGDLFVSRRHKMFHHCLRAGRDTAQSQGRRRNSMVSEGGQNLPEVLLLRGV